MALDIDLYRSRLETYKIGTKDSRVDVLKNQILKDFKNNPSYFEVQVNGITKDVIIVEESSLNRKPDVKHIIAKPNDGLNIGDLVVWNSNNWLCIDTDLNKTIYSKGVIKYCNNILKWQDSSHNIIEVPCIISKESFSNSSDIEENKYNTYQNNDKSIVIPRNTDTISLEENQRFIFNNSKDNIYKIAYIENLDQEGLLILSLEKDEKQYDDRLDLNIANHKESTTSEISGSDTILLNDTEVYTTSVAVTWSTSNSNVSIISEDSQSITLKGNSSGLVTLTANDGVNTYTKDIEVTSLY